MGRDAVAARVLALVALLPSSGAFAGVGCSSQLQWGRQWGRSVVHGGATPAQLLWKMAGRRRADGLPPRGQQTPALTKRELFGRGGRAASSALGEQERDAEAPFPGYKSDADLDGEEARALESLSSILTTDDGLRLSGAEMRDARSNWVRDIMTTGRSRVLTKISSRLAVSVLIASTVAAISNWSPSGSWWLEFFEVPGWPHELVGGFLGILLVFRTDQAYGRFWEGRTQWSTLAAELRSLARVTVANRQILSSRHNIDEVLAHLAAYPVALKQHLRGENDPRELESLYDAFGKTPSSCGIVRRILNADNAPLVILMALSSSLNAMIRGDAEGLALSQSLWERSEDSLNLVSQVLSECEKIKCTPLPLSYSRHSSRFFTLFSITLPFALVKDTTPLLIAPVVLGISWILFATDEIGHVIEEPFGSGLAQEQGDAGFKKLELPLSSETFSFFDSDKSGSVDAREFSEAMQKMGIYLSMQEAEDIVNRYDENGDRMISNEEWRRGIVLELERKAAQRRSGDLSSMGSGVAARVGDVIVMGINGFYDAVGMVFGISQEEYAVGVKQLEVLPLARYCRSIQRDILEQVLSPSDSLQELHALRVAGVLKHQNVFEQVLFVSRGQERQRYITIARKLAAISDDVEVVG